MAIDSNPKCGGVRSSHSCFSSSGCACLCRNACPAFSKEGKATETSHTFTRVVPRAIREESGGRRGDDDAERLNEFEGGAGPSIASLVLLCVINIRPLRASRLTRFDLPALSSPPRTGRCGRWCGRWGLGNVAVWRACPCFPVRVGDDERRLAAAPSLLLSFSPRYGATGQWHCDLALDANLTHSIRSPFSQAGDIGAGAGCGEGDPTSNFLVGASAGGGDAARRRRR